MKIYVDLVLFLNFFFDFLLLLATSLILRRNVKIKKIFLGALIGSLSIFLLFVSINSFTLFLIKILISILMTLTCFGYKTIKYTLKNISYLYLLSIVLGGALYFINSSFSYKNYGFIFFNNGFSINIIIIILFDPVIIFLYVKKVREEKDVLSKYYSVSITFLNNKTKTFTAFLDTGNNLYDPYKKRPVILISKSALSGYNPRCILVPCLTVNKESLIKCFKIKKLIVNGNLIEDECLVGISDNNFNFGDVDLLLHNKIVKER